MSRRDKSHNLAVGVITRGSRRKRDTETLAAKGRFGRRHRPGGDVSDSRSAAPAERGAATQVVAEPCVKTRAAGAMGLGLGALTCGYRSFRYPISSGRFFAVGNVSVFGRERLAESDGLTQLVAKAWLKTRKAEALRLGLVVLAQSTRLLDALAGSGFWRASRPFWARHIGHRPLGKNRGVR